MFSSILTTLNNCFKIPELKSRIIYTLAVLAICRLAQLIPTPGLDGALLKQYFESQGGNGNSLMGMYSLFTGGGFEQCAVGSLGIMPYISATIIIQLLTAVVPFLSKLAREEGGRTKIVQYGRVLTLILCLGQAAVMAIGWPPAYSKTSPATWFTIRVGGTAFKQPLF
jgi:preprotein translocase subunit SecY